jgi:hypothetical protein
MPDFEAITYSLENQVAWITMNRPDARNAINDAMREELLPGAHRRTHQPRHPRARPDRHRQGVLHRRRSEPPHQQRPDWSRRRARDDAHALAAPDPRALGAREADRSRR